MKRVLVAGATGYLGGFVAREFKARGHFVRALARSPEKLEALRESIDETIEAEVTRPETLKNVCDGIDVVFSSVGITKQKDKLTFKDVDYQGNRNLLDIALKAGVRKFIYVSVFNGPNLLHLDIVRAHEEFVQDLKASGIDYAVIRPTGYFSDMGEFLEMARKGRVWLIGRGDNRMNPIHGADLAKVCVDTLEGSKQEIDVGGPEVLAYRQVAESALNSLGKPVKISSIPAGFMKILIGLAGIFKRHQAQLLAFFVTMMTSDMVAPVSGTQTLSAHFADLVSPAGRQGALNENK
jgi:uncharacterized protein YbjT (DUF2867 family)